MGLRSHLSETRGPRPAEQEAAPQFPQERLLLSVGLVVRAAPSSVGRDVPAGLGSTYGSYESRFRRRIVADAPIRSFLAAALSGLAMWAAMVRRL